MDPNHTTQIIRRRRSAIQAADVGRLQRAHEHTMTSMGRLTLNMLLSFAQFEREVH